MAALIPQGQAFNRTRQTFLATTLSVADTHWTRLRGLLGLESKDFPSGHGLWIVPCSGIHTLGMGFPIDVLYLNRNVLDRSFTVVDIRADVQPWRFAPIRSKATSVLELPSRTAAQTKTSVGDRIDITTGKDGPPPAA